MNHTRVPLSSFMKNERTAGLPAFRKEHPAITGKVAR
jgi:hypothetical protein